MNLPNYDLSAGLVTDYPDEDNNLRPEALVCDIYPCNNYHWESAFPKHRWDCKVTAYIRNILFTDTGLSGSSDVHGSFTSLTSQKAVVAKMPLIICLVSCYISSASVVSQHTVSLLRLSIEVITKCNHWNYGKPVKFTLSFADYTHIDKKLQTLGLTRTF